MHPSVYSPPILYISCVIFESVLYVLGVELMAT